MHAPDRLAVLQSTHVIETPWHASMPGFESFWDLNNFALVRPPKTPQCSSRLTEPILFPPLSPEHCARIRFATRPKPNEPFDI